MAIDAYARDERSKACVRALSKLLTGNAVRPLEDPLPPVLEVASAGAIFVTDSLRRVVHLNRRAAALASHPAEAALGRTCRDAFRCLNCPPTCPLSGGVMGRREVVMRGPDGSDVTLLKTAEPLVDERGTLVGGLEVMHELGPLRRPGAADRPGSPLRLVPPEAPGRRFGMVGRSAPMRALFERLDRLARVDATVLVTGESGTGKELVSRALHLAGPRARRPFHAINCAALPGELLESELFGHERGAFTGALRDKPGRFEVCEDGTLLLDEIGCLPLALQPKLLRVLEDGGFERVGGTQTRRLRARVIAATNAELAGLVREGSFRADLRYRLEVCVVRVPPLRECRDDIEALALHFAEKLAPSCGLREASFTPAALEALQAHPWPGNVRELRNAVHAALLLTADGRIGCEHLPGEIAGPRQKGLDRARIEEALVRARFNRARAAELLGVSRATLWRHMKRARIE